MAAKTPESGWRIWPRERLEKLSVLVAFWVLLAAGVVVLVAGLVVGYFWVHPDPSWPSTGPSEPPITLAEADPMTKLIQSALLILGFLGVTATAVTTYRRQRTAENEHTLERDKFQAERDRDADQRQLELEKFRQECSLEWTRRDAETRRIREDRAIEAERSRQERYAKGAQMLAHESTSIRIAGLNVICQLGLEVAAQEPWRQICVNLICSYLRSPPPPPQPPATAVTNFVDGRRHTRTRINTVADLYLVVTEEACRLLADLLKPVPDPEQLADRPETGTGKPASHPLDLDLRGATLTDFLISGCYIQTAHFDGTLFTERARFDRARFAQTAHFSGAQFTKAAEFKQAQFAQSADFSGAQFTGDAEFNQAQFAQSAVFSGAQFTGDAVFNRAQFTGDAWSDVTWFVEAQFAQSADFSGAQFINNTVFNWAQFTGHASFDEAEFTGRARFDKARFVHQPTGLPPEWIQPSQ